MHKPKNALRASNLLTFRALVKMSAIWLLVRICSSITYLDPTNSWMKWCLIFMCFVLLCWTRFLDMLMALRLLQYKVIASWKTSYSCNICFIHNNWVQLLPTAIYSAFTLDKETQFYFLLNQDARLFSRKKHPPELLLRFIELPANLHLNSRQESCYCQTYKGGLTH